MMNLSISEATRADRATISGYMRELFAGRDAGVKTPAQVAARMGLLLGAGYRAFTFRLGAEPVGYALVQENGDHVFIRHFFITKAHRRQGLGRAFFRELEAHFGSPEFRLDVLEDEQATRAFWRAMGFDLAATNLRRSAPEEI